MHRIDIVKRREKTDTAPWWDRVGPSSEIVIIKCPECGVESPLRNKSIDEKGSVWPSVACPTEGCRWHVFVKLCNWGP